MPTVDETTEALERGDVVETPADAAGLFAIAEKDPSGGWLFGEWKPGGRLHFETFETVDDLIERMAAYAPIDEWRKAD